MCKGSNHHTIKAKREFQAKTVLLYAPTPYIAEWTLVIWKQPKNTRDVHTDF